MYSIVEITAPILARKELQNYYNYIYTAVQDRLSLVYTEMGDDDHKKIREPPDLKWYLQELRKTATEISKLESASEREMIKGKTEVAKTMVKEMSREEKIKARREIII